MSRPEDIHWTDGDGNRLQALSWHDSDVEIRTPHEGVMLTREQATEVRDWLSQHLLATEPPAQCGHSLGPVPKLGGEVLTCVREPGHDLPHEDGSAVWDWGKVEESTVATEAHGHVYGARQGDYGHPREDFTRTAVLWTGLLQHKLADGEYITPEDYARCMVAVKLSRDVHSPKRDNRIDMAGYAICLDRLETGK